MCSAQRGLHLALRCLQGQKNKEDQKDSAFYRTADQTENGKPSTADHQSIHEMSTEEWRAAYERDGCVDLWVEEEFNSGSRLMVSPMALLSIHAFIFSCVNSKFITYAWCINYTMRSITCTNAASIQQSMHIKPLLMSTSSRTCCSCECLILLLPCIPMPAQLHQAPFMQPLMPIIVEDCTLWVQHVCLS